MRTNGLLLDSSRQGRFIKGGRSVTDHCGDTFLVNAAIRTTEGGEGFLPLFAVGFSNHKARVMDDVGMERYLVVVY